MTKSIQVFLIIAGLIGVGIGFSLLFFPISFQASANIHLDKNASLLSEIRSPGAALLMAGIIMLLGAFRKAITRIALQLSALFYLAYGLGRLVSMAFDGLPNQSIIIATVLELVIGGFAILLLRLINKRANT